MANVEILVKVIEDSSDLKKIEKGFEDLEKKAGKFIGASKSVSESINMTAKEAKVLIKQFEQLGVNTDEMSDEFLNLNPEVKQAIKLLGDVGEAGGEASKGVGDLKKQLFGLAKGFVGITGAVVAGRALAKFAKDSLAAADAAGKLPPIFAESEKVSLRLKEAVGEQLAGGLENTKKAFVALSKPTIENIELSNRLTAAHRNGLITQKELNRMRTAQKGGAEASARVLQDVIEIENAENEAIEKQNQLFQDNIDKREALAGVSFAERGRGEVKRRAAFEGRIPPIPVEIIPFFKDLDLNIGEQINTAMAKIDFAQAGGRELVQGFQEIFAAVDAKTMGSLWGQQAFGAMAVQSEQVKVAMGTITAKEAAKNIRDTLGVSFQEALAMVNDVEGTLRRIDGFEATAEITIKLRKVGGGVVRGPESFAMFGAVNKALGNPRRGLGFAHGGSGKVPPGFPNDSFPIGLTSGEEFNVRTPGQQNNQMGGAGMEAGLANLGVAFRDGMTDLKQAIVEAIG